ncbi:MAG: hypothetical protein ACKV22_04155 [Bryobacteraceae bacterium]
MMNYLKKLIELFSRYFQSGQAEKDLLKARNLVGAALPLVQALATLTPSRSDDEIVALFTQYSLPYVDRFLALPAEKRGLALMDAASTLLGRQHPGTATRILNAAVQMAYMAFRSKEG